ncbi:hypothetical protein [Mycolicibacterium psychrotolerans]|nr:hypothetical protein [Mycolicibacterium psychrotolerans]
MRSEDVYSPDPVVADARKLRRLVEHLEVLTIDAGIGEDARAELLWSIDALRRIVSRGGETDCAEPAFIFKGGPPRIEGP